MTAPRAIQLSVSVSLPPGARQAGISLSSVTLSNTGEGMKLQFALDPLRDHAGEPVQAAQPAAAAGASERAAQTPAAAALAATHSWLQQKLQQWAAGK